jgi:hypothetical protein
MKYQVTRHDQEVSKLAIFAFSFFAITSLLTVSIGLYLGYTVVKYSMYEICQSMVAESAKP